MRILHVVRPASGGMKEHVLALIKGSLRRGMEVGLACPGADLAVAAQEAGACTFSIHLSDVPGARDLLSLVDLGSAIFRFRPDLLHLHGLRAAWLGRLAAKAFGLPAVVTYHATLDGGGLWRRSLTVGLERRMAFWNTKAIAVSDCVRQDLEAKLGLSREAVETILNGIDLARLCPLNSRPEVRACLGLPMGVPVVGTIARLAAQKDLPTLLDAARMVVKVRPDAHFLLIGDGPLRAELDSLAAGLGVSERVHFLGQRRDVPDLLHACDVFALSSRYEGGPLAALEAMACGIPVVSTAVGCLPELSKRGLSVILVAPGDVTALAGAILRLIEDEDRRIMMGHAARRWVSQHLHQDGMIEETCRVYRAAMDETAVRGRKKATLSGGLK